MTISSLFYIAGQKTWEMPELTSLNKLPAHATLQRNLDQLDLNGTWDFQIKSRPSEVNETDVAQTTWSSMVVPGNWTMQGFGHPQYTNVQMPFECQPPTVPDENPTGVYRRSFEVPADWVGRRVVLHFGGSEGVLYVYLNGQAIGLSKDARTPAEFDVSDQVRFGAANELIAVVVQWSDASYVEDQDHWWQAGLQRDVFLYTTPKSYIQDVFALGDLSQDWAQGSLRRHRQARPRQCDRPAHSRKLPSGS